MNKRLMLVLLCAICIVFNAFALTACQDKPNNNEHEQTGSGEHKHTYSVDWSTDETFHWHAATCEHIDLSSEKAEHSFDELRKCSVCGYVKKLTFAEFIENFKAEAQAFVSSYIEPNVIKDKTVLSREYYVNTNSTGALDTVNIIYTYKTSDIERAVEIAHVTFEPISLEDFVTDNFYLSESDLNIESTTVFEFDAKDNYNRQSLANALYSTAGKGSSVVKLFTETTSSVRGYKFFNIFTQEGNVKNIVTVVVKADDGTDETLITNLANPNKYEVVKTVTSYEVGGVNVLTQEYELEDFDDGSTPQLPGDEPITDAQVKEALDQNCVDGIINQVHIGVKLNKENISNANWYVTTNEDGTITRADYTFNYRETSTSSYYIIGSVEFSSGVSKQDLINGNFSNATYKSEYTLNYNPAIQEARSELTEAILKTCLGELTYGSTRIIVDNGARVDNKLHSTAREFTVAEITVYGVQEYVITIQSATSDNGYIQNLINGNYYINSDKSYEITGIRLVSDESNNL